MLGRQRAVHSVHFRLQNSGLRSWSRLGFKLLSLGKQDCAQSSIVTVVMLQNAGQIKEGFCEPVQMATYQLSQSSWLLGRETKRPLSGATKACKEECDFRQENRVAPLPGQ